MGLDYAVLSLPNTIFLPKQQNNKYFKAFLSTLPNKEPNWRQYNPLNRVFFTGILNLLKGPIYGAGGNTES